MSTIPASAVTTAPASRVSPATDPLLHPAADAPFEVRWAAWQARGRVQDAATRRHALIGAPLVALAAVGLYVLLGR